MNTFSAVFNHISLHVSDVEKSVHFYTQLLGMKQVPRPDFDFDGAWISMGNGLTLHLIAGKNYEPQAGNRSNHFAFTYPDINALEKEFAGKGVEIFTNKIRVDGIRQMFIKDPDGYYIEFNEDLAAL